MAGACVVDGRGPASIFDAVSNNGTGAEPPPHDTGPDAGYNRYSDCFHRSHVADLSAYYRPSRVPSFKKFCVVRVLIFHVARASKRHALVI